MSITSITGSDQALAQFYQQISGSNSSSTVAAPAAAASSATVTDPSTGAQPAQAAGQHHHGHGGFFKKIESAVTTALQAAKSDPSADPNKVVQDAIAKVFKDNGQTPPAGTDASAGVKPESDSDADASATQPNADISSARQAFAATLKGFGIDANQFHQDFLAAVQGVQSGGSSDTSTLFQDFPPGSSVDTTA